MKRRVEPKYLRDLLRLLDGLHRLHGQLLTLVRSKIDAMRRAEIAAMRKLSEQEQTLARRLEEREGLRRQLMDTIGEQLGLPPRAARALSVSQLASLLSEEQRAGLLDIAGKLREAVAKVAQANRVAGAISREILTHLKWVFASVRPADVRPVGYSGGGEAVSTLDARIFETVG